MEIFQPGLLGLIYRFHFYFLSTANPINRGPANPNIKREVLEDFAGFSAMSLPEYLA